MNSKITQTENNANHFMKLPTSVPSWQVLNGLEAMGYKVCHFHLYNLQVSLSTDLRWYLVGPTWPGNSGMIAASLCGPCSKPKMNGMGPASEGPCSQSRSRPLFELQDQRRMGRVQFCSRACSRVVGYVQKVNEPLCWKIYPRQNTNLSFLVKCFWSNFVPCEQLPRLWQSDIHLKCKREVKGHPDRCDTCEVKGF